MDACHEFFRGNLPVYLRDFLCMGALAAKVAEEPNRFSRWSC
jgi:hypothetical protein